MQVIGNQGDYVAGWVAERLDTTFLPPYEAVGIYNDNGLLVAGVVYSMMRGGGIEMSIAADSPRWASKRVITQLLRYPFDQLRLHRITAITESTNIDSRKLLERLGFQHEGTVRCATAEGLDEELYGLTKRDFDKGKYNGKVITKST